MIRTLFWLLVLVGLSKTVLRFTLIGKLISGVYDTVGKLLIWGYKCTIRASRGLDKKLERLQQRQQEENKNEKNVIDIMERAKEIVKASKG